MKLLVATRSAHKMIEIRRILAAVPDLELVDPDAVGIPWTEEEEGLEPYDTFEENAASKARYFRERSGLPTVADDSGLVVDALDGAPGVRSKRFAPVPEGVDPQEEDGEVQDRRNNEHLLERLADVPLPERTARYVCVAVLDEGSGAEGGDETLTRFRGEAEGLILARPKGWEGFGYDPLFHDPVLGKTFAEISREEKNARSHRGKAFRALADHLRTRSG